MEKSLKDCCFCVVFVWPTHEKKIRTVPLMPSRHTGQFFRAGEHWAQLTRWPQGKKVMDTLSSQHKIHIVLSLISVFFSTRSLEPKNKQRTESSIQSLQTFVNKACVMNCMLIYTIPGIEKSWMHGHNFDFWPPPMVWPWILCHFVDQWYQILIWPLKSPGFDPHLTFNFIQGSMINGLILIWPLHSSFS